MDKEHGRPTKSLKVKEYRLRTTEEDDNASMVIVRATDGVSDNGQKVSLSLTASNHTDNKSCAGGWGSMHWYWRSNIYHC